MNRLTEAVVCWLVERGVLYEPHRADDVVFPRDPIVPVFEVEEIRYDLDHATVTGLLAGGFETPDHLAAPYEGLTDRESELLCDARCELVEWRERLGG